MTESLKGFLYARRQIERATASGSRGVVSWVRASEGRGSVGRYAPVGVQHGRGVATEQGDLVGQLASFAEGDDGECAAAAGLPIDS